MVYRFNDDRISWPLRQVFDPSRSGDQRIKKQTMPVMAGHIVTYEPSLEVTVLEIEYDTIAAGAKELVILDKTGHVTAFFGIEDQATTRRSANRIFFDQQI